jgi:hypothetical protein
MRRGEHPREPRRVSASETLPPPQDLDSEEAVLGAVLAAGADGRSAAILSAIYRMDEAGETDDAVTLAAELDTTGALEDAGGKVRVHELAHLSPSTANVGHWARIVRGMGERRAEQDAGKAITEAAWNGGLASHPELAERIRRLLDGGRQSEHVDRITDGRAFASERPTEAQVWGGAWMSRAPRRPFSMWPPTARIRRPAPSRAWSTNETTETGSPTCSECGAV